MSNGRANVHRKYGVTRTEFATLALKRFIARRKVVTFSRYVRFCVSVPPALARISRYKSAKLTGGLGLPATAWCRDEADLLDPVLPLCPLIP